MQIHCGFPLGRLLGPGTKSGPKTRLTNGWPVGRSRSQSRRGGVRRSRLRLGANLIKRRDEKDEQSGEGESLPPHTKSAGARVFRSSPRRHCSATRRDRGQSGRTGHNCLRHAYSKHQHRLEGSNGFGRYIASSDAKLPSKKPVNKGAKGAPKRDPRSISWLVVAGPPQGISANAYHCAIVGADQL